MNSRMATSRIRGERAFILATVLIFLVVLSLSAFLGAKLTRTDIQVVNNLQNEKEAFAIAEAGIHEALYRMSVAIGDRSTVNGQTFNASLAPTVPGRSAPAGVTSYAPDFATATSTSQILFTTSGVPSQGTNSAVPTLQPAALQIPYSLSTADTAPVNLASTADLTIGWDVCKNGTDPGCSATGAIRRLPLGSPRYVAKIVSTGRSGTATRKITAQAVDCIPSRTPGNGSIVTLGESCPGPSNPGGLQFNGVNHLSSAGSVQVNAGAGFNPPSSCTGAITSGGSQSSLTAQSLSVSGNYGGNGAFTPSPTTGSLAMADPYSNMQPPCYNGGQTQCQGTPVNNVISGSATDGQTYQCSAQNNCTSLQPGIYYGGIDVTNSNATVTMASGYYIIVGGGFSVGNGAVVQSAPGGVMIFNTKNVNAGCQHVCAADSFSLSNGTTNPSLLSISASNDPFSGVVFFQDRAPTNTGPYPGRLPANQQPDLNIQGGNSGRALDGLVYAPDALLAVSGTNTIPVGGSMIVQGMTFAGGSGLNVQNGTNPLPNTQCGGIAYQIIGWQDF
jgi:Tfp pilus assembly protein PilX